MKTLRICVLVLGLMGAVSQAADQDDFYVIGSAQSGPEDWKAFELGATVGYGVMDSLGLGLRVSQNYAKINPALKGAVELRWFFEPFELAGWTGVRWVDEKSAAIFGVQSAYLWALTTSLALRAEVSAELSFEGQSLLFLGIGARILF
jgi:hypothetical protein